MLTNLHHKWNVQSVLPLLPTAKQPPFHIHIHDTLYNGESIWQFVLAVKHCNSHITLDCAARPVCTGSRRWWAERTWHAAVAPVPVHVRFALKGRGGGHCVIWRCQKLLTCCGTLREPTMPTAQCLICEAMRLKFVRMFRKKSKNLTLLWGMRLLLGYFGSVAAWNRWRWPVNY